MSFHAQERVIMNFIGDNGRYYTKSLFIEFNTDHVEHDPIFTLERYDVDNCKSFYQIYLSEADPTEYRIYTKYLDGIKHWRELCQCNWFKPHLDDMRLELEAKIRSEALSEIMAEAKTSNSKFKFAANKLLLDGWSKPETNDVGRPTKQRIKDEANKLFKQSQLLEHESLLLSEPTNPLQIVRN